MQRNHFVDVLKGIFIIFIIVLHFPFDIAETRQYLFPFWLNMTVPFFMILSGYVSALSFQKKEIDTIEKAYKWPAIFHKIIRYTVPYAIAFAAEWIVFRAFGLYQVGIRTYGIFALALDFLRGGKGQGSYYFPIMIQLIFVFPIIYFVIRKYNLKGLGYCFLANAAFEILKTSYGMSETEYRLLIFRYLFVVAAGCFIAVGSVEKNYKTVILSLVCMGTGLGFAYLFSYTPYTPKIITFWQATSFLVCLFIVPGFWWLLRKVHFRFKPLEIIGKASFNIFLVQMIYYNFAERMYALIPNRAMQLAFNIVNCVVAGVIFYYIEQPVTRFVGKKVMRLFYADNT